MRDLIVFAAIFAMLPFCFARPFIGVLVWSWLGYMNPHRLTWGFAFDFPFVQLAALATLSGMLFLSLREKGKIKMRWERESVLLVVLGLMFLITTFFALRPDLAWPELEKIAKTMLLAFVTIMLVDDVRKLRLLLLVITLSVGYYGLKGGLFSIATGGQHMVYGPLESSIGDNTAIALGLNMILPGLFYLAKSERQWWLRWGIYATFFLSVIAVVFTYSRGGLLGLAVVLGMIALGLGAWKKTAIAILIVLAAPVVMLSVPDKLIDRAASIKTYEEDGSAQARLGAWRTAWMIAQGRPLTGGGFQVIDIIEIGVRYNPDFKPGQAGAHSIYFEVLGENGFVTFFVFVSLLISAILSARNVRKQALRQGLHDFACYGHMLQIGLLGYAVSGAFLEFASFDLFYQLVAVTIVTKFLFDQKVQSLKSQSAADAKAVIHQAPRPQGRYSERA